MIRLIKIIKFILYIPIKYYYYVFYRVNKNRILFSSYQGKTYSCNPKSFSDYILKYHRNDFDINWAFTKKKDFTLVSDIKVTKIPSCQYYKTFATSRFIIHNTRMSYFMQMPKKSNQFYIQTWHGTALKKIEKDASDQLSRNWIRNAKLDSKKCNLMIAGSEYQFNLMQKSFWYNGEILKKGTPRNDIFFYEKNQLRKIFYEKYNINVDYSFILYAPTFRDNGLDFDDILQNTDEIINTFHRKFGGKWKLAIKLHPNLLDSKNQTLINLDNENVVRIRANEDIQPLLTICNALITDISSIIFDFFHTKKPCFLFMPDITEYNRGYYIAPKMLPLLINKNIDELKSCILNFKYDKYQDSINQFDNRVIKSFETGNASQELYNWMYNKSHTQV